MQRNEKISDDQEVKSAEINNHVKGQSLKLLKANTNPLVYPDKITNHINLENKTCCNLLQFLFESLIEIIKIPAFLFK